MSFFFFFWGYDYDYDTLHVASVIRLNYYTNLRDLFIFEWIRNLFGYMARYILILLYLGLSVTYLGHDPPVERSIDFLHYPYVT